MPSQKTTREDTDLKTLTDRPNAWPLIAATLAIAALALLPRYWGLGVRPPMHDESMFAFYGFDAMRTGHYNHMPILHGPALMLSVGWVFRIFGDSMAVARAWIATCSLVALAAGLGLVPRRGRWWFALLFLSSPVLLYYSRFFRNEMLFNGVLMLGMLGMARSLSRSPSPSPWRMAWGALGVAAMLALLCVKENALFVYASGVSFALVVGLIGLVRCLARPGGMGAEGLRALSGRGLARLRGAFGLAGAGGWGFGWGWILGGVLGASVVAVVFGRTTPDETFSPLANLGRSWTYWEGQHSEHRIEGPIHYHLPIIALYELPILLMLAAGLVRDAVGSLRRAAFYVGALAAWAGLWKLWSLGPPPAAFQRVFDFLHIDPDVSMLVLGLLIVPLLVWSLLAIGRRRMLGAWMAWWAACSLFQYSSAGEKVPWLAVHMTLPLYLALPWIWASAARHWGRRGWAVAAVLVLATTGLALRNDIALIGPRAADPVERILYNHTTPEFGRFCNSYLSEWERLSESIPLEQRTVVMNGAPSWPGYWYFRHCRTLPAGKGSIPADADLVLGEVGDIDRLAAMDSAADWVRVDLSLREAWLAEWPKEETRWLSWWRYYWLREVWHPTGGYPIAALEPRCLRR